MNVDKSMILSTESIRCLAGSLDELVHEPLPPYSEEALSFLADVSNLILKDRSAKAYPDIVSFAYWCRKSNMERKRKEAASTLRDFSVRIGRGLSFHVAPSNIPVNFAFSFVFGLLAGNACIVRVPSKPFAQTDIICRAIDTACENHPGIAERCAFISYPPDNEITGALSLLADARIIWGGDATVESIRRLPANPRCVDIPFSDRYSIALLDGAALDGLDETGLSHLATGFFNDTFLMDQNACSSPQMIFWINGTAASKERFWRSVYDVAEKRYKLQPQISFDKYVQLCEDIIDGIAGDDAYFNGLLTVVDTAFLPDDIAGLRGKGGYFYQKNIASLEEIAPLINEKFQTLLYFGIDPSLVREFILKNRLRGIDRIVPIGSAMDIDIIWDGYDLVGELSRIIDIR